LHSLGAGLASTSKLQSLLEIIEALCSGLGLLVTAANVQGWLDQEADFQAVVTGRSPVGMDMYATSGMRSFLSEIASLNQKMRARELEMQEAVAGRNQEIRLKNNFITELEQALRLANDEIRLKNNFITELEQALRLANDSIGNLTQAQAKLLEELDGAKAQIRRLHVELHHILHSRSWRYTAILRRLTKRVFAPGSAGSDTSPQLQRDRQVVTDSGLFDSAWYLAHNPDVASSGVDPLTHFLQYGGAELRDPGPNFCSRWYLDQNPDVQGAGVNPLVHYARFGASEGRRPKPDQRRFHDANDIPSKEELSSPACIMRAQEEWERAGRDRLNTLLTNDESIDVPRVAEPPLSIIMVLYNKAHLSLLSIESILSNADIPFELILVDNASEDKTAQLLERISGATVMSNSTNVGFGPACMQAAAPAKGKILCFINNDVLLLPNSLGIVLEQFRSDSSVGAVGGKILLADGSLQEAGSIIWSDGSAQGYGRCDDPRLPQYCFRRPVDYCSGAFLFTPTELFRSLGGFSADFAPAYYEDTDYCMAVWQNRLQVIYEPSAVIRHYESASSGGNETARDQMADQQRKFVEKWRATLSRHHRPQPENVLRARIAAHSCNLRIVYIDDRIPHRRLGSGFCRANYIVDQLARMGHCVTCVSLTFPLATNESEYVDVRSDIELFDGFSHRERLLHEYLPNSDIVWISRPHNMQTILASVEKMALGRPFRIVYDAEAIFAERERLKAKIHHETGELSGVIDLPKEIELAKAAEAVVVVSPKDQATMLAAGVADVSVIGHQITPTPTPATFEQRRTVLFVGAMHGSENPNADSMRYFCTSIWPQVRDATSTTLVIVGYGTDTAVGDLSTESVRVLGAKEDLTPFYNDARVFIVPTRYAGGIPYKAHEAAAHGVPMVVSEVIAHQLDWRDEEDYLVARDVRQFADSCSRLFRDWRLWQKLRSNALERVDAELNERRCLETLSTLITRVVGTGKVNPI
jgi:GT2 family glycosyltransferase